MRICKAAQHDGLEGSEGILNRWKKVKIVFSGLSLVKRGPAQLIWSKIGRKHIFQQSFHFPIWVKKCFQCRWVWISFTSTLHLKSKRGVGDKHSKVRLDGLEAGNTVGEKLSLFTINKLETRLYYKGVKSIPCQYESQAWMGFWNF